MRTICLIFLLAIVLLGITFSALNADSVAVNYYLGRSVMPLSLLLVITFASGSIIGMLVTGWFLMKTKLKNYRLKQRLSLAQKEVENLRAIPLQDK